MCQKMVRLAGVVTEVGYVAGKLMKEKPLVRQVAEGNMACSGEQVMPRLAVVAFSRRSTFVIVLGVLCMHAVVLSVFLQATSSSYRVVTPSTVSGVLIEMPRVSAAEPPTKPKKARVLTETPVQSKAAPQSVSPPFSIKQTLPSKEAVALSETIVAEPLPEVVKAFVDKEPVTTSVLPVNVIKTEELIVAPPHLDATGLNNPPPIYPRTALRLRQEGTVILSLLVRADGSVDEMGIKKSSGYARLDKAALKAVKRWRYMPAQRGDEAIDFWYEQPIVFSLRN